MHLLSDVLLAPFTTFGIGGPAENFLEASATDELTDAIVWANDKGKPITILGGGSNVLVDDAGISGLVIRLALRGIEWIEQGDTVRCRVAAGENWDEVVEMAVERGLWGIENLSGIPGSVGAAPIQNIGAYGAEMKDVIDRVEAVNSQTGERRTFSPNECGFGYRWSYFKSKEGRKWAVTRVEFLLSKTPRPKLAYKDLAAYFEGEDGHPPLEKIRKAVLAIRKRKFPDLSDVGTAGSFFMNPIISVEEQNALLEKYPELPFYETEDGGVKVSAAWILDNVCNLKGYQEGRVRLFEKQPLVLVAEEGATAVDVRAFAENVQRMVREKTGIMLTQEVRYLPEDFKTQ